MDIRAADKKFMSPAPLKEEQQRFLANILYNAFCLMRAYPGPHAGPLADWLHNVPLYLLNQGPRPFSFDLFITTGANALARYDTLLSHSIREDNRASLDQYREFVAKQLKAVAAIRDAESQHERVMRESHRYS